jgi:hypothetical protein
MRTLILASLLAAGLSGCVQSIDAPMSPTFGQAVATMDTQIIPTAVSDQPPSTSGAVAAAALGRYEKGQVYPPETQSTSNLSGTNMGYGGGGNGK